MSFRKSLNALLARWGMVIEHTTPQVLASGRRLRVDFHFLIRQELARFARDFAFLQIGANDGVSRADDLMEYVRHYDLSGTVVEPQPDVYERLRANFRDHPRVTVLNKAVHQKRRTVTLYRLDPGAVGGRRDLPVSITTNGIASFNRDQVVRYAGKYGLEPDLVEPLEVACITVEEALESCLVPPHLIKIDVEGYDAEILQALDLSRFRPRLLHFENLHMSPDAYRGVIDKLSAAGYHFLADRMDTTAYRFHPPLGTPGDQP